MIFGNLNHEIFYQKCRFCTRRYSINIFKGFIQKFGTLSFLAIFAFFFESIKSITKKQNTLLFIVSNMPSSSKKRASKNTESPLNKRQNMGNILIFACEDL